MEAEAQAFVDQAKRILADARSGEVALDVFEQRFLSLYSGLPDEVSAFEAATLEEVFWAIEEFVGEDRLRRAGELDEAALRRVLDDALESLGTSGGRTSHSA